MAIDQSILNPIPKTTGSIGTVPPLPQSQCDC